MIDRTGLAVNDIASRIVRMTLPSTHDEQRVWMSEWIRPFRYLKFLVDGWRPPFVEGTNEIDWSCESVLLNWIESEFRDSHERNFVAAAGRFVFDSDELSKIEFFITRALKHREAYHLNLWNHVLSHSLVDTNSWTRLVPDLIRVENEVVQKSRVTDLFSRVRFPALEVYQSPTTTQVRNYYY